MITNTKDTARPATSGYERSTRRLPAGLAFSQLKASRFSGGSDSGRTKMPYSAFTKASPAAAKKGSRRSMPPRSPPMAGPKMNPRPKATPTKPKFLARTSGSDTSAM